MNALWIMDVLLYIMIGIGTFAVLREYFEDESSYVPILLWPFVLIMLMTFDILRGIWRIIRWSFID